MSKVGSHDPFGHLKHKLWSREGSKIALISLRAGGVRHVVEELSIRATTLLQTISTRGLYAKLCALKVVGIPTLGVSRLPLGSPGTKCHLGAGLVTRHKVYYEGEPRGFPQV